MIIILLLILIYKIALFSNREISKHESKNKYNKSFLNYQLLIFYLNNIYDREPNNL